MLLWNKKRDNYTTWLLKLQQQYGDVFEVWLSNKRKVYICNPEYFDKLLPPATTTKWFNRMEQCWNNFGDDYQIVLNEWMRRFATDMIIEITTGKRAYTLPVYFNKFTTKKLFDIPSAVLDDSEYFIQNMEKMRPISHSATRLNTEPDELLAGNKNSKYWKDPEIFNPDRFMCDDNTVKKNFIFFGRGIRQCPGRKLSMIELKGIIAMLFRKYDVTLMNEELHYKSTVINSMIEKMSLKITPRKDTIIN
ncbi:21293_t:CDS:2 [Dentiscutata erythropus]|uniref:21293_t:CDS:1 n=1 Tax=Dentiscutata erythropus TaxID=1348616 RepID=A0A9N9C0L4_9GLOM|nr:21293_t:CDS:2 [Dentiscutata erythropus]